MRVFLISTYIDLVEHRSAVADSLQRLGLELRQMETFGARPQEPVQACFSEIDLSDLFVGLYAHRYGFVPTGSDLSITETEFNHASEESQAETESGWRRTAQPC